MIWYKVAHIAKSFIAGVHIVVSLPGKACVARWNVVVLYAGTAAAQMLPQIPCIAVRRATIRTYMFPVDPCFRMPLPHLHGIIAPECTHPTERRLH